MDPIYGFVALIGLFYTVVIITEPFRSRSRSKRIQGLEQRLTNLVNSVRDLHDEIAEVREKVVTTVPETAAERALDAAAAQQTKLIAESEKPPAVEKIVGAPPAEPVVEKLGVSAVEAPAVTTGAAPPSPIPESGWQAWTPQTKPPAAPPRWRVAALEMAAKARRGFVSALMGEGEELDWETLIGGRWLDKIGIVILVIGVSLFLGYTLRYYGPLGKIATGVGTGLVLLAGGMFLEKTKAYRLFARPLIGGGWALLYFSAFAAHNVEAARIIDNPAGGLGLLFVVAAGIIAHSFKYRSQVVTGLAYGLGFLAVAINPLSYFSLVATAVLAAALVAVIRVMPWYHLGLVGVAATYVNHLLWQQLGAGDAVGISMQSLWLSQGLLAFYWLAFVATVFVRRPQGHREEYVSLVLNVANTVGFFALSVWQTVAVVPNNLYLLTGAGAVAYVATAYLLRVTRQRVLHLVNASVAVVLAAVTFPLAVTSTPLTNEGLAVLWVAEAVVVMTVGFRLKEITLRIEAYLLCLAGLVGLFAFNLAGAGADEIVMLGLTVPPVAVVFFYLFEKLPKAAEWKYVRPEARSLGIAFGYAATALIAALLWDLIPIHMVGVAWLAAGVLFFEFGARTSRPHVRGQGYALLGAAFVALLAINVFAKYGQLEPALLPLWATVSPAVLVFYYLFLRLQGPDLRALLHQSEEAFSTAPSYAATVLLTVLLWKEAGPDLAGLAWLGAGLLLFEWGARMQRLHLRWQGYALSALALGPLFIVNLYGLYIPPEVAAGTRLTVVGLAVVTFYALYWRLWRGGSIEILDDMEVRLAVAASIAATALLVVLLWKELNPVEVSLAWAALALALFEIGSRLDNRFFRLQGHVLAALAFGRLFMANFTAFGDIMALSHRLLTVLPVAAIFYYFRYQIGAEMHMGRALKLEARLRPLYSYGAAVLLVVLARFELGRAYAIVGWAPLMVALLVLGVWLRDRDFRFQSYLLAILIFARGWATSFVLEGTLFGIPERYATSLPAIAALLAAAFYCLWRHRTAGEVAPTEVADRRLLRLLNKLEVHSLVLFSFLGTALLTILLFYEVSGNLLTIAWTVEAFALLAVGFLVMERSFRLYGLGLLLICLIKLVAIDLADVETLYRIFSFIVLGIILLLISLGYTRYRDVITRYL